MRKLIVGLGLFFVLGCAGIGELMQQAADVKMDVKSGDEAVHPADFPLPAPQVGTILESTNMSMAGMSTTVVMYDLPAGTDNAAILDQYEAAITDLGLTPSRSETGVKAESDAGKALAVEITEGDGSHVLTLTEVQMKVGKSE